MKHTFNQLLRYFGLGSVFGSLTWEQTALLIRRRRLAGADNKNELDRLSWHLRARANARFAWLCAASLAPCALAAWLLQSLALSCVIPPALAGILWCLHVAKRGLPPSEEPSYSDAEAIGKVCRRFEADLCDLRYAAPECLQALATTGGAERLMAHRVNSMRLTRDAARFLREAALHSAGTQYRATLEKLAQRCDGVAPGFENLSPAFHLGELEVPEVKRPELSHQWQAAPVATPSGKPATA